MLIEFEKGASLHMQTALKYAAMGWHVFPCWPIVTQGDALACGCGNAACKSPGKHPMSRLAPRGQGDATTDAEQIRAWWSARPDANIAVYLGVSGLCAVDIDPRNGGHHTIDDLEAKHGKIESDVVQLTGGGGEHRVFLRPDGNLPGALGKGVDLKMNGYIMAYPSNHISGAAYEWEGSSDPLDGAIPSCLPDWMRNLSQTQQQQPGQAQLVMMPLLLTDHDADDIESALLYISAEDRDTWLQVGMALHSTGDNRAWSWWDQWSCTSDKYDAKDQYRTWRSFRNKGMSGVQLPTLFAMAMEAGWGNGKKNANAELTTLTLETDESNFSVEVKPVQVAPTMPEHLTEIPCAMLQALGGWMETYSEEPQPQITVQACLAVASTLAGRLYVSDMNNTSNVYLMTLAGTGVGKNYAKTCIRKFLASAKLEYLLSGSGSTSAGAVMSALFDAPTHIQIIDEFGKQLQAARKQPNGMMQESLAILTEIFSDATGVIAPKNYSSMGLTKEQRKAVKVVNDVHCPSITLMTFATHEQVFDNLSTAQIDDGFLNRLLVVDAHMPCKPERRPTFLPVPEFLSKWAHGLRNPANEGDALFIGAETDYDQAPTMKRVKISAGAMEIFDEFKREIKRKEQAGEYLEPKIVRRWREVSMRLALALTVCDEQDEIPAYIAEWCVDYVRFYGGQFMQSIASKVADSDFYRLYLAVSDAVQHAGRSGLTERELTKKSRLFAQSTPMLRDQAVEALVREGQVQRVQIESMSGRGKKRIALIWSSDD